LRGRRHVRSAASHEADGSGQHKENGEPLLAAAPARAEEAQEDEAQERAGPGASGVSETIAAFVAVRLGALETVQLTVPVYPLAGTMVTFEVPALPEATVASVAVIEKLFALTVMAIVACELE